MLPHRLVILPLLLSFTFEILFLRARGAPSNKEVQIADLTILDFPQLRKNWLSFCKIEKTFHGNNENLLAPSLPPSQGFTS
jgi:hypothetical protein